jgi:bifunctional DNase/RNase
MAEKYIEMELREIHLVENPTHSQIIVLGEKEGTRTFPIFIGLHEALALEMAARGEQASRPLTHDLILNVLEGLEAQLLRVLVVKLEHDTFYGALEVRTPSGEIVRIDARPSDSMVLATKCKAPIFVEEKVLDEVGRTVNEDEDDDMPFDSDDDSDLGYDDDEGPDDPDLPDEER